MVYEKGMQPKKVGASILPCAGITLIRFNGYDLSLSPSATSTPVTIAKITGNIVMTL